MHISRCLVFLRSRLVLIRVLLIGGSPLFLSLLLYHQHTRMTPPTSPPEHYSGPQTQYQPQQQVQSQAPVSKSKGKAKGRADAEDSSQGNEQKRRRVQRACDVSSCAESSLISLDQITGQKEMEKRAQRSKMAEGRKSYPISETGRQLDDMIRRRLTFTLILKYTLKPSPVLSQEKDQVRL